MDMTPPKACQMSCQKEKKQTASTKTQERKVNKTANPTQNITHTTHHGTRRMFEYLEKPQTPSDYWREQLSQVCGKKITDEMMHRVVRDNQAPDGEICNPDGTTVNPIYSQWETLAYVQPEEYDTDYEDDDIGQGHQTLNHEPAVKPTEHTENTHENTPWLSDGADEPHEWTLQAWNIEGSKHIYHTLLDHMTDSSPNSPMWTAVLTEVKSADPYIHRTLKNTHHVHSTCNLHMHV